MCDAAKGQFWLVTVVMFSHTAKSLDSLFVGLTRQAVKSLVDHLILKYLFFINITFNHLIYHIYEKNNVFPSVLVRGDNCVFESWIGDILLDMGKNISNHNRNVTFNYVLLLIVL